MVILKRGAFFIGDTLKKIMNLVPLTEEQKERMIRVKKERIMFLAKKKEEDERNKRLIENIKYDR